MKSKKPKVKIKINNHLKAYGETDTSTNIIQINKKKHKGNKRELADTIKHELYHVKHPNATEKTTYKATGKLKNMSYAEEQKYLAKLRNKSINYKVGSMKRKFKMNGKTKPGDFISEMNKRKIIKKSDNQSVSKQRIAIMGLV